LFWAASHDKNLAEPRADVEANSPVTASGAVRKLQNSIEASGALNQKLAINRPTSRFEAFAGLEVITICLDC